MTFFSFYKMVDEMLRSNHLKKTEAKKAGAEHGKPNLKQVGFGSQLSSKKPLKGKSQYNINQIFQFCHVIPKACTREDM